MKRCSLAGNELSLKSDYRSPITISCMSAYATLLYSNTFNVITITLKRPESYEVLNEAM